MLYLFEHSIYTEMQILIAIVFIVLGYALYTKDLQKNSIIGPNGKQYLPVSKSVYGIFSDTFGIVGFFLLIDMIISLL